MFGHWHGDSQCPYFEKNVKYTENPEQNEDGAGVFCAFTDDEDSDESFFGDAHSVMMTLANEGVSKGDVAVSDTGCSRTVAGAPWIKRCLRRLWEHGIPYYCVRESQAFRFGPGPRVVSEDAIILPTCLTKDDGRVYLRVSVVQENVPLLVSHRALTMLGAVMDLPEN